MANDTINEGFGTSAPATLATATVDILCRYIAAPPDQFARIRAIDVAQVQMSGAVGLNTVIPLFIIRGHNNMGVSAAAGGALVIPLRPTGLVMPGLPDISQLSGAMELLLATYIPSRAGRQLIVPDDGENHQDWSCRDGQKLAVCVGPLVDVSVSPAVLLAGAACGTALTVIGSQGKLSERTKLPGQIGPTKSLQRYEIEVNEILQNRVHPSSK
jgi:hypothetical protein